MTVADPVVKGEAAPWPELPKRRRFDKATGWGTVRTWQGPLAGIDAQLTVVSALSPEAIDTTEGSPAEIQAVFPDQGIAGYNEDQSAIENALWELDPVELEKRLETHPQFRPQGISLKTHAETMEKINKAILDGTAASGTWVAYGANYDTYRDMRLAGVDSYPMYTWIIRRTIAVSRASQVKASFDNVNKVVSYSSINVPSTVKWGDIIIHWWDVELPGWTDFNLSNPDGKYWLVKPPRVMYDKRSKKHQIQNEWWGAMGWSSFLYDGGGATP